MKKRMVLLGAASLVLLSGCCMTGKCSAGKAALPAAKTIGKQAPAELRLQKNFFLPEKIYAVPGVEVNIYFKNVFLAMNPANYMFDVNARVGRHFAKRWSYTPAVADAGKSFPLTLQVMDENGIVAEGKTTIIVSGADAGKGRKLAVLMVGDSLTNATIYPARVHTHFKKAGNPAFTMIGSHRGGGRPPVVNGVAHEGYGGWRWDTFLTRYNDPAKAKTAVAKFYSRSKFITKDKNGKIVFDLKGYLAKYAKGRTPDIVTFQLGVNDVFAATDANRCARIETILKHADALLAAFRKELPNAVFGVGFVTGGSGQDSFGANYKNGQTAWGYAVNHFRLNQAMAKHFAGSKDSKLYLVPSQINLDTENNFPDRMEVVNAGNPRKILRQRNGVHPAAAGYNQMGDTYYAFMKYILAKEDSKTAVKAPVKKAPAKAVKAPVKKAPAKAKTVKVKK